MPPKPAARGSGFTYKETYQLYNEQLHYGRATYTTAQLDAWQADWNSYFAQHGMEIPAYAHRPAAKREAPPPELPPPPPPPGTLADELAA